MYEKAAVLHRLRFAVVQRPYTMALAVVLPVPGALAVIYGDAVSAALSKISTGIVSRLMGAALLVGALMTLAGIAWGKSLVETTGLAVTAAGCAVYGLGVILGLGLAGAVAGSGFLAITVGTVLRISSLTGTARNIAAELGRDDP